MIEYKWNPETHTATCIFSIDNVKYVGTAICHPTDLDFESEKTGQSIAIMRAQVKICQAFVKNNLKPRLAALNQLYYSMNQSKKFNPDSYENKMLQRQIQLTKNQLTIVKEEIANKKQEIKDYINQKDEFYKTLRANRNKTKTNTPGRGFRAKMDNLIY